MSYSYRNWSPDQVALLPTDPREWLPSNHLAYQVRDAIRLMDLSVFRARLKDARGARGFDPELMLAVFLYALCKNVCSSRAIAQLCRDDLGARFLAAGSPPQYRCLAKFRQENAQALSQMLAQTVLLCQQAGLVDVSELFVDGTKLKANASLRKNVPYENIDKALAKIEDRIAELFAEADQADAQDEALFGPDQDDFPDGSPGSGETQSEHQLMVLRREKLLVAKKRLEDEAQRKYEGHLRQPVSERTHRKAPTGTPEPDDRANPTDLDSAVMRTWDKGYVQAYNGQIVVEKSNLIIVGAYLTNEANDYNQLLPALKAVEQTTGTPPQRLVADAGYFRARTIQEVTQRGVEVLIPPKKIDRHLPFEPQPVLSPEELAELDVAHRMMATLATEEGHTRYRQRMSTVEPTFALIKGCPGHPGFRQFLSRGLERCTLEWSLICAVHNLKRYFASRTRSQPIRTPALHEKRDQHSDFALI